MHITLPADPANTDGVDVPAEALDRGNRARLIRKTRTALGLSQTEFASRFLLPVGTLRDWEQARATAPDIAIAYVRVIGQHPDMDVYIDDSEEIDGFTVNRPGGAQLFDDLFLLMRDVGAVLYWADAARCLVVADLSSDMLAAIGPATTVFSGSEIVAAIRTT